MDRVATNAGTASGLTQEGPEGDGHTETEALKGALVVDRRVQILCRHPKLLRQPRGSSAG